MVTLERAPWDAQPGGERVQLVGVAVADQVRPQPSVRRPHRRVHEHRHPGDANDRPGAWFDRPVTVRAVLFDFAGTLLVPVPAQEWVREVTDGLGEDLDDAAVADLAERLVAAGRPGGPEPGGLPPDLEARHDRRDVSTAEHRSLYTALLGRVTGEGSALTRALYDASCRPEGWSAYPDSGPTLRTLRSAGVATAVVSNVGFDLRAVFAGHGLVDLVDVWALSCELGVVKPAPEPFRAALDGLGVAAADALMVGDNPRADGAATALGIRTLLLPYSPARQPHGLAAVLDLVRGAGT